MSGETQALHLVCILSNFTVPFNSLFHIFNCSKCISLTLLGGTKKSTWTGQLCQSLSTNSNYSHFATAIVMQTLLFCCKTECQEFNESSLRNMLISKEGRTSCIVKYKLHSLLDLWENNLQS